MRPAVFVDRDGVVNSALIRDGKPFSPRNIKDLVIMKGVKEAVCILHELGFVIAVVTNQPDVARGDTTLDSVLEINNAIKAETGLHNFYICIHDDKHDCECRKPKIGLIRAAAKELELDVSRSFMVGDRWKDIEAGQSAGCQCFYVDHNYLEKRPTPPFRAVTSLLDVAKIIKGDLDAK